MVLLRVQRVGADVARDHVSAGGVAGAAGERQAGANPAEKDRGGQETGGGRLHLHTRRLARNQKTREQTQRNWCFYQQQRLFHSEASYEFMNDQKRI